MRRKQFTEQEVLESILCNHGNFFCYRCKQAFVPWDDIEREHLTELALGGEDTPINCAYSHKDCHAKVTNGTKATTAGSSKQRIAKMKRLTGETPKRKGRKIPSRPFPKGRRKMQSRGFQKYEKV